MTQLTLIETPDDITTALDALLRAKKAKHFQKIGMARKKLQTAVRRDLERRFPRLADHHPAKPGYVWVEAHYRPLPGIEPMLPLGEGVGA